MITTELVEYIRVEIASGRAREEIRTELVNNGWNETDLSEAFRIVIPMQGLGESSMIVKNKNKILWHDLIFVIVGLALVVFWYLYKPEIINFWDSGVSSVEGLMGSYFGSKASTSPAQTSLVQNNTVVKSAPTVEDCGTSTAPDLTNPLTYQNNKVLDCLGNSALYCKNAKATLQDPLFPTSFEVVNNQNTCNFKLSYSADSTLVDVTGKKLAGQYLICPVSIVKGLDETKKVSLFTIPDINNPSRYASQIYFYGTLGLFIESNIDQNKIQSLGCNGNYISSVIASYLKTQEKKSQ